MDIGGEIIDLSIGIEDGVASEPNPASIEYMDHAEGAEMLAANIAALGAGDIEPEDFPDGMGLAWETITAIPHTGTHFDAPWHFGPTVDGEPAKTIDEVPINWCIGEGVILDFRDKEPGYEIDRGDIKDELARIGHELSGGEIVVIQTGADKHWGTPEYLTEFPGMGADATHYLIDKDVRVMGTDAYGFDKPFQSMAERYSETSDPDELWPAHFAGRHSEYCHIEKMANLESVPVNNGFTLIALPVKIEDGSAGWVRPVAVVGGSV